MKQILLSLAILFIAFTANAQVNDLQNKRTIDVNGSAELEISPDMIYFRIILSEEVFKGKKELEDIERKMVQALIEGGVDIKKDLTVQNFSSNYDYSWFKGVDVYSKKMFQLVLHDSPTMDKVFKKFKELEISNVQLVKVDHSRLEDYKKEVGIMAMKAAKAKADYLLEAVGYKAGQLIYVSESGAYANNFENNIYNMKDELTRASAYGGDESSIPLDFKKIKLSANVFLKFEIEK